MLSTSQSVISEWDYIEDSPNFSAVLSGPKPLPVPTQSHSLTTPGLKYGGLPLPKPRAVPKSLQLSVGADSSFLDSGLDRPTIVASTSAAHPDRKKLRMSVPTEHSRKAPTDELLRIKQPSQCTVIQKLWDELVSSLQPYSKLIQDIEHSIHRAHDVARILDNFAATTLAKYIPALTHFVDACHCLHIPLNSLTAVQMADGLIAVRLARSSDGIYMNSATIIKALRWSVKQLGVDCFQCSFDGLISKFLADKIPRDVKESLPLPLYCFLH